MLSQDDLRQTQYSGIDDEELERSFAEFLPGPTAFDATDLELNTPFKRQALLPASLPFWYCWDVHRLAPIVQMKPLDLDDVLRSQCDDKSPLPDQVWKTVRKVAVDKGIKGLPPPSQYPQWIINNHRYEDQATNQVAYFTGALDWEDDLRKGLFKLRLNECQLEQSCRFYRQVGADRFLVLYTPLLTSYPASIRKLDNPEGSLHQKIIEFLSQQKHFIAGRWWRVCDVDEEKTKLNKKKKRPKRLKFILFAVEGYGITQETIRVADINLRTKREYPKLSLHQLMDWHLNFSQNSHSTDLKLFARMGLGFSKTTPTIELEQHEFVAVVAKRNKSDGPRGNQKGEVMDDGCSLISLKLAKAVWAMYGKEGPVPSVVQGRIGGAKGLFLTDYTDKYPDISQRGYWIEVSESQLKIHPHPRYRDGATQLQRTFEVLKYWGSCREGALNTQLITILEDRGVPREVFRQAVEDNFRAYADSLTRAMTDPKKLRLWMQENGYGSTVGSTKILGSFPRSSKDQLKILLESGFHPENDERVVSCVKDLLTKHTDDCLDKMRFRLPYSTVCFCMADPLGILKEDEICINFSRPVTHPITGIDELSLEGLEVLLARNPAHLASDIQRRKAVYCHELRNYKDVVIFPTQGMVPLASLLSGGDYDGDTVAIVYDPAFVEPFVNAVMPALPPPKKFGMTNESRPLSNTGIDKQPTSVWILEFMRCCVAFNIRSNLLGLCSAEHEKLVYKLSLDRVKNKLSSEHAVKLAALASSLVDSRKQGWLLTDEVWHKIRSKANGGDELAEPAYKSGFGPTDSKVICVNELDYLHFNVARHLRDTTLKAFATLGAQVGRYDGQLSDYWRHEDENLTKEEAQWRSSRNRAPGIDSRAYILKGRDGLYRQLERLQDHWNALVPKNRQKDPASSQEDFFDNASFNAAVAEVYGLYTAIEPPHIQHFISLQYEHERARNLPCSYWSLLKASCLHYITRKAYSRGWVWFVAGRELCILKALSRGEVSILSSEMHDMLKVDTKRAKRIIEICPSPEALDDLDKLGEDDDLDVDDDETVALDD
jgi:hypothetical protein